eukprot:CAMPEP_0167818576 /NCGR_PEP_ID=MMETSP0112_2-20121227/4882_1 /TAXON_ID=91324 /ORGANISM="Lotharella globosa, Strain CCCM811" /LENGTH=205 /DNA_ID=CAMNT_0007718577 /DNA_START=113 /DNA_END=731 /DNA_ORIENTATION=-
MGAEHSAEARYKKQLLKLSWRLVLTVQEQAASAQNSQALSKNGDASSVATERKLDQLKLTNDPTMIKPFHEDFENSFFKYCPDLKSKFPSNYSLVSKMIPRAQYCPDLKSKFPSNYSLVSKMIQTFIGNAIEAKDIQKLGRKYGKSHKKYNLKSEHFEGFSHALVDTIQSRLGKFGTIELIKIWRDVTDSIVKVLEKEYMKAKRS